MLCFYPEAGQSRPGTRITLWLKTKKDGQPLFHFPAPDEKSGQWDPKRVIRKLREEFYGTVSVAVLEKDEAADARDLKEGQKMLDPAFEVGRFIVWPLYPVLLAPVQTPGPQPIRLDDAFHLRELVPLDSAALAAKAREWDTDISSLGPIGSQACDWQDRQVDAKGHVSGTGSRLRLVSAQPGGQPDRPCTVPDWAALPDALSGNTARWMLADFTEPQLPEGDRRYQCLVNGVRILPGLVPSDSERDCKLVPVLEQLPVWPRSGGLGVAGPPRGGYA